MQHPVTADILETGVASGGGPWAKLQVGYGSYAKQMGFAVDPCRVRQASDKGKVERRRRDLACLPIRPDERFADVAHLQQATDQRVDERSKRLMCPLTGNSMHASWKAERGLLQPLPMTLPEPFDVEVTQPVHDDCLVHLVSHEQGGLTQRPGRAPAAHGRWRHLRKQ